jgi:hypothetical protein
MEKLSAKVKRPLWVAGLNIALALTVGSTQAFAGYITTVAELLAVNGEQNYVLINNLDLATGDANDATDDIELADEVTEGSLTYISNGFTGTFDGGGFTISGLTKPLFDFIDGDESSPTTTISDLTLVAAAGGVTGNGILAEQVYTGTVIDNVDVRGNVSGGLLAGGLVGWNDGGSISNSSATGDVDGLGDVGGLVGVSYGTITDSSATGTVIGNYYVGGLVGSSSGTITDSYAAVTVLGIENVGGLVGYNDGGTITNSYATGAVTGDDGEEGTAGGLVGWNDGGSISNSYATGAVTGDVDDVDVGGLVGFNDGGTITNSYATGAVTDGDDIGGLVGEHYGGTITNSYATGAVTGDDHNDAVGGLVGFSDGDIFNSYATGAVTGLSRDVGGLVGDGGEIDDLSYATGAVKGVESGVPPLSPNELLEILNRGFEGSPIFALASNLNSGRPYLLSNPPLAVAGVARINSYYLQTQVLDSLSKSVGFTVAKSDLSKLDLALLDQVNDGKSAQIIGAKLFSYQSLSTSLSAGSIFQLEIGYEANKSLQMWVKSSEGQYVLVGDVSLDKDGNALLPGIEFKKSGQYELIFVNSDKKDLTQPELVNKVSGLTVYVN